MNSYYNITYWASIKDGGSEFGEFAYVKEGGGHVNRKDMVKAILAGEEFKYRKVVILSASELTLEEFEAYWE